MRSTRDVIGGPHGRSSRPALPCLEPLGASVRDLRPIGMLSTDIPQMWPAPLTSGPESRPRLRVFSHRVSPAGRSSPPEPSAPDASSVPTRIIRHERNIRESLGLIPESRILIGPFHERLYESARSYIWVGCANIFIGVAFFSMHAVHGKYIMHGFKVSKAVSYTCRLLLIDDISCETSLCHLTPSMQMLDVVYFLGFYLSSVQQHGRWRNRSCQQQPSPPCPARVFQHRS